MSATRPPEDRAVPVARRRPALSALAALALLCLLAARGAAAPGSLRVDYDALVERGSYTHGGRTVGEILDSLSRGEKLSPGVQADLQPHLEPFSFALNDVAGASSPDGAAGWVDVSDAYPRGSRQPAWAALFREGRYRLYHRGGKVRLFLQGEGDPAALFRRERGVVRHPLLEVMARSGRDRLAVEVYAFRNDYRSRSLLLSPVPFAAEVARENLLPRKGVLPMGELVSFFSRAALLEGAEVDDAGNLFLYGRPGAPPALAGEAVALSDLAVVYRAVFHSGPNAPFVSLDRNEDNREAKVNLGGLLEDTRVGTVVLEADKVFKTLATGLSSDGRAYIEEELSRKVPGFRTSSARTLDAGETGVSSIRYWFYPDRVRTVTDGFLCAVESARFVADAERLDRKVPLSKAQRDTIGHLNRNYDAYARALPPLRELDTVGRLMAVATWLSRSGAARKADLSALLSVELPPHATPRRTRKIVAVALATTAVSGNAREKSYRLFHEDNVLDRLPPTASDVRIIEAATARVGSSRDPAIFPKTVREARGALALEGIRISRLEGELRELEAAIAANGPGRSVVPGTGGASLLERHEEKKAEYNRAVSAHNDSLRKVEGYRLEFRTVATASGGINLRPDAFAKPRRAGSASPLLSRLRGPGMLRSSTRPAFYSQGGNAGGAVPAAGVETTPRRAGGAAVAKTRPGGRGGAPSRPVAPRVVPSPPSAPRTGGTVSEDAPDPRPLPARAVTGTSLPPGREVPLSAKESVVMSARDGAIVLRRAR